MHPEPASHAARGRTGIWIRLSWLMTEAPTKTSPMAAPRAAKPPAVPMLSTRSGWKLWIARYAVSAAGTVPTWSTACTRHLPAPRAPGSGFELCPYTLKPLLLIPRTVPTGPPRAPSTYLGPGHRLQGLDSGLNPGTLSAHSLGRFRPCHRVHWALAGEAGGSGLLTQVLDSVRTH